MKRAAKKATPHTKAPRVFPVAGIGASAGGLEAFTELLKHLPADTGMSFVLVQHLDPVHESELTRLLARHTSMPTCEVTNNLRAQPGHVYVIPPNTNMTIAGGVLKLQPRPKERGSIRSIDVFFESLAEDQRERAIGVILSGTASDGTLGLEAIKGEGGITFAQDQSAKYDSMPRSAIAAGCADFVLSPKQIALELARIAAHPYVTGAAVKLDAKVKTAARGSRSAGEKERESSIAPENDATALPSGGSGTPDDGARQARNEAESAPLRTERDGFGNILLILRNHCGVDFSLYKSTTIRRRVARRMLLSKHDTLADYAAFLKGNMAELDTLFSDVLISVTSFFRNPEAFETLRQMVFPQLVEQGNGGDPVRVWVLGCSTGQEAYSIAMAFAEFAEGLTPMPRLQVFATDLNDLLLEKARGGLYAKTLAQDISAERLRRFFTEEQGGYRIIKPLRDQIVFARQNLISDPPFSRMDLISCRNLLIYLEPDLQKKIMPSFHYALRPGGFLFLGASESIGHFTDLFEVADKKEKLFRKKAAAAQLFHVALGAGDRTFPPRGRASAQKAAGDNAATQQELTAQREADRYAINQFVPPSVLVNADLQIIQFRGSTSAYLEPPSGRASFDVLKMARRGLMLPLRAALNKARKDNEIVRKENLRLEGNGEEGQRINIQVVPLKNVKEHCFLVLFEPVSGGGRFSAPPSTAPKRLGARQDSRRISDLESELADLRDYQQSVQEQAEASNEELQASNEEVQSANEELQSINEELETSKEELESTNEELTTVNEEMASRNAELHRANADLINLQVNLNTAIMLLDCDQKIRRFTAPAEKIFNLMPTDIGRPFSATRHHLALPQATTTAVPTSFPFETAIAEVIESVRSRESEVQDRDGRWYAMHIRPYMTLDRKIDGAMIMLSDIDALKRSQQQTQAALEYVQAILRTSRSPLLVLHDDLRVNTANEAFERAFQLRADQIEGRSLFDLSGGAWRIAELSNLLHNILPNNTTLDDFEVRQNFPGLGVRTLLVNASRLRGDNPNQRMILLSLEDITERKHTAEVLHEADLRKDEFLATLAHELRNPLAPISNAAQVLRLSPNNATAVQGAAEVMLRQIDHMTRLIEDLLDASRISRGRIVLRRERVDLCATLRQTADTARALAKDREISLAVPSEPIEVNADPVRVAQIIGNLLANARKFTGTGGRISLSANVEGEQASVRVRDNGIGMVPEQIPRIFDMFTQLDTSLERSTSGLGIGLALVKRLVEMHGGSVEAYSSGKDRGSEFVVRLPIIKTAADPRSPDADDEPVPPMAGRRILIVDDNHDAALTLANLLQLAGHTTHVAEDGLKALEAAPAFQPDVALVDIGMPKMNGYDVARRIRKAASGNKIVLIALTGLGQDEDRQKSHDAGFDGHLIKPADYAAIARVVAAAAKQ